MKTYTTKQFWNGIKNKCKFELDNDGQIIINTGYYYHTLDDIICDEKDKIRHFEAWQSDYRALATTRGPEATWIQNKINKANMKSKLFMNPYVPGTIGVAILEFILWWVVVHSPDPNVVCDKFKMFISIMILNTFVLCCFWFWKCLSMKDSDK